MSDSLFVFDLCSVLFPFAPFCPSLYHYCCPVAGTCGGAIDDIVDLLGTAYCFAYCLLLAALLTAYCLLGETFQAQLATLLGDVLLASAFVAYIGFFDHRMRHTLVHQWKEFLTHIDVVYKPDLSLVEYLSTASERIEWSSNALPDDELCVENAIILHRFNRYPLIIDPSGQAVEYLLKQNQHRRIHTTSFLDLNFMKHLESALRFGTCLLVQDVENVDPILNPVLNQEFQKTGGRVLVRNLFNVVLVVPLLFRCSILSNC